ncbi:MAG: 4'-phosphopantetheinyl transferase superfamily protein [Deltaproteobacteria bacterium]|nr:4'-phosphopantetheinyl transferase superfamily protein [Deltaproteobacteria bacterium]
MNHHRAVFQNLLPPNIIVEESKIEDAQGLLFPDEEVLIARAVEKRRKEFTAGRTCLRNVLAKLGVSNGPILQNKMRSPQIPQGYTATITHSGELCAAAAVKKGEIEAIGIDVEEHSALEPNIEKMILVPNEQMMINDLPNRGSVHWEKVIFSAKESFYKAYFQITEQYLDYLEAEFLIEPENQRLSCHLLIPSPVSDLEGRTFQGKYKIADGYVFTAFAISRLG